MSSGNNSMLLVFLLGALSSIAHAATSTTKTTTSTFLLPSIPTSASEHIYAMLLTASDTTTLWALGCQPDLRGAAAPTCTGAFRPRPTLTSGPSTLHLVVGGGGSGGESIYDCTRGADAPVVLDNSVNGGGELTCRIKTGTATNTFSTTTLAAAGAWMTPVTVIGDTAAKTTSKGGTARVRTTTVSVTLADGDRVTSVMTETVGDATSTTTAPAATTTTGGGDGGKVCRRDVALEERKVVGGGSGAGDATTGGGNGAEGGNGGGVNPSKGNNNGGGGGCSAGSRIERGFLFVSGMAGICLMMLIVAI
ncbi:hypothetical protein PG985_014394 [Apiospora marii]|uniref:uncharacterized protein n=1 Tax=Apiospora marii TaxID=335849 RepID=UPI00312D165F